MGNGHSLDTSRNAPVVTALAGCLLAAATCALMPTPYHLFGVALLILLALIVGKAVALSSYALVSAHFLITFNWLFASAGMEIFKWRDISWPVYAKAIAFLAFLLLIYQNSKKRLLVGEIWRPDILLFSTVLLISASLNLTAIDITVGYIANVFFPLVASIILINYLIKRGLVLHSHIKLQMDIAFGIMLALSVIFCFFYYANFWDIHEFVSLAGAQLRSGPGPTLTFDTVIFGVHLGRFSGLFPDPIIAGYFWAAFIIYIMLQPRNVFSWPLVAVALVLLALTLSKGSMVLLFLGIIFIVINLTKFPHLAKFSAVVAISLLTISFMAWWGLRPRTTDSSAVHVLGLILPFVSGFDYRYIFGHGLSDAGNMGGWVAQGAESFVGLVQYSVGLTGTIILAFWWLRMAWETTTVPTARRQAILGLIVPLFVTGALQENVFNLPYIFPRLVFLALLFSFFGRVDDQSHHAPEPRSTTA